MVPEKKAFAAAKISYLQVVQVVLKSWMNRPLLECLAFLTQYLPILSLKKLDFFLFHNKKMTRSRIELGKIS